MTLESSEGVQSKALDKLENNCQKVYHRISNRKGAMSERSLGLTVRPFYHQKSVIFVISALTIINTILDTDILRILLLVNFSVSFQINSLDFNTSKVGLPIYLRRSAFLGGGRY